MNTKLKALASLVNKDDYVLDMACDHAYLAIYLKKNNLAKEVFASDININALNNAKNNIKKAQLDIPTYLSNGFKNISNNSINTVIIAGVGANTILNIVKETPSNINKYLLSSNNHPELIRKNMLNINFYLNKEIVVKDKDKFYTLMLFTKTYRHLSNLEIKYGLSNNIAYFTSLINDEYNIIKCLPKYKLFLILKHYYNIFNLKKIIKERTGAD